MPITLKCFATLSSYQPPDGGLMDISNGETVGDIVDRLGIPKETVALIFINSRHCKFDTAVNDGDMVGLFPLIGGG
jgi:sulfur-carrier protein